jgi:hypothetical protein
MVAVAANCWTESSCVAVAANSWADVAVAANSWTESSCVAVAANSWADGNDTFLDLFHRENHTGLFVKIFSLLERGTPC